MSDRSQHVLLTTAILFLLSDVALPQAPEPQIDPGSTVQAAQADSSGSPQGGSAATVEGTSSAVQVDAPASSAQNPNEDSSSIGENAASENPGGLESADVGQQLQSRLDQLRTRVADAQLEESVRTEVEQLLSRAEADLKSAQAQKTATATSQARIKGLPTEKEELDKPVPKESLSNLQSLSMADLEARRTQKQLELAEEREQLTTPEAAAEEMTARKRDLQQQLAAVDQAITENALKLSSPLSDNGSLRDTVARTAAEVRSLQLNAQRGALQAAEAEVDTRLTLGLPAIRARRQQKLVAARELELQALESALADRSRDESTALLEEARRAADDQDEFDDTVVRDLIDLRLQHAATNSRLTEQEIPAYQDKKARSDDQLQRLQLEAKRIRENVGDFGVQGTIGRDLLDLRDRLPHIDELNRQIAELDQEIASVRNQMNKYSGNLDAAEEKLRSMEVTEDEQSIRAAEQVQGAIDATNLLVNNSSRLSTLLSELYTQRLELAKFVTDWNEYVSEQALWVRSHGMLSWTDVREAPAEAIQIATELLQGLPQSAVDGRMSVWVIIGPALVAILLLLAVQQKARRFLIECGTQAARRSCISIRPTVRAMLLSFGMAAEWPLLLMLVGNVLRFGSGSRGIYAALGLAIAQLGTFTLWLNFIRQLMRKGGLADAHFSWNETVIERQRRWLRNVILVISPPLLLLLILRFSSQDEDHLERLLFVLIMLLNAALMARLLLPTNNHFVRALVSSQGFVHGTRILWIGLIVVLPLGLATLSVIGFHYTAVQLWMRLSWTVVIASLLLMVDAFLLRWLLLSRRATRMKLARERAAQREQQQLQAEGGEDPVDSSLPPVPSQDEGLAVFGLQAHSLIRNVCVLTLIGCSWAIWFDVLPALKVLDRHEIWSVDQQVTVDDPNSDDPVATIARTESVPVTVGNVMLAAFTTFVTFIAVRQLPGLIEIILLSRMTFEPGVRYAVTTVIRYLVLVAGVVLACSLLGLRWAQVQWLVAGLSVGLGFGLQEVFANFVSGIIILLERPIRIGDIVTIDNVSGVVSRIRIRATSITDWDRREYIVPNKEFVTGKLLNWTLSDTTNRIVVNVGIAYGSNTDRARQVMLEVAGAHGNIMSDPAPVATFENFGDSSLDLVLRAYLPNLDNRLTTISDVYSAINRRFTEEGITIPFPQRDLHVFANKSDKSGSPLSENIVSDVSAGTDGIGCQ